MSDVTDSGSPRIAVCGLIFKDGKMLAVERFPKTGIWDDWNLPGGKLNPGETLRDGLIREIYEETGLVLGENLQRVYLRDCGDDHNPDVTVFTAHVFHGKVVAGTLRHSDEGNAAWVTWAQILAPHCTFRDYNQRLYDHLKEWWPDLFAACK